MNRHFHDARYYLRRAGEHATLGVKEELAPVEHRVRGLTAGEDEDEPQTRVETVRAELEKYERAAEREATTALETAKETLAEYRTGRDTAA